MSLEDRIFAVLETHQNSTFKQHLLNEEKDLPNEEEEEVVDLTEQQILALLDAQEPALSVVSELFLPTYTGPDWFNVSEFKQKGWTSFPVELPFLQARQDALDLYNSGSFVKAGLTTEQDPYRDANARGDYQYWLKPGQTDIGEGLISVLEYLSCTLQKLLAGLIHLNGVTEYQLAVYPALELQQGYDRHRDAFPVREKEDEEQRRVTAIVYLNPQDWNAGKGGELRLFRQEEVEVDFSPSGGKCVVFLSGVWDHQVLPFATSSSSRVLKDEESGAVRGVKSGRIALTAWYR